MREAIPALARIAAVVEVAVKLLVREEAPPVLDAKPKGVI